jgi:hypothetical protein
MNKITVDKNTLLYVMEQTLVKGIALGKNNTIDTDIESVVKSLAEQFTNDVSRYSLAKCRV